MIDELNLETIFLEKYELQRLFVYIVGVFLFIFDISNGFVISNISDTLREPFKI
jgi:hypothetical protein